MTPIHLPTSLRLKVSLGVVVPLLVILGIFTSLEYQHLRSVLLNQLSLIAAQAGQIVEDNLRVQMLKNDFTAIQQTLDSIGESGGFQSVSLLNTQGEVIFAPAGKNVGKLLNKSLTGCQSCHTLPPSERLKSIVTTTEDGTAVFRSMKPIENEPACANCHEPNQRLIGLLLIDISTAPLEESLTRELTASLLWWGGTVLIILVVVNLVLHFLVTHPLEGFAAAFNIMGTGQPAPKLPASQQDEIGRLAQAFNLMASQIENRHAENTALSARLQKENTERRELLHRLITAQENERKRIARELHDELGQSLSGLSLHSEAISRLLPDNPDRAREQTETVRQIVRQTSDQIHNLIVDLRPSVLDDLGLVPALRAYTERIFEKTGVRVQFDTDQVSFRLPQAIETSLYRACQEALTNVIRHSRARHVVISMSTYQDSGSSIFETRITDDGVGFDPTDIRLDHQNMKGLGLLGMIERITQCGGRMDIDSNPSSGTTVKFTIPLDFNIDPEMDI